MQKKSEKTFRVLEIIGFDLVVLKSHFYRDRILIIESQDPNKQSQDFRYN